MNFMSALGPLMAGMGQPDQSDMLNAQMQNDWQQAQLNSATQMATQANQGFIQASGQATDAFQQSSLGQQQALAAVVEGFRNALLNGIRQ